MSGSISNCFVRGHVVLYPHKDPARNTADALLLPCCSVELDDGGHWQEQDIEIDYEVQRSANRRPDGQPPDGDIAVMHLLPRLAAYGREIVDDDGNAWQVEKYRPDHVDPDGCSCGNPR